ncbi:hypothetical protein V8F33_005726 [Rhypophila sp. PSN 637]
MPSTIPVTRDATPYPGETFIILHKPTNRAIITLSESARAQLGDVVHVFSPDHKTLNNCSMSQCQWLCVERNGWLGFRASPTGRYMGHRLLKQFAKEDDRDVVAASTMRHGEWEYCCVRRHPRGGYLLMMRGYNTQLLKVEIGLSSNLVLREDGGALWEFVKVDGICG